MPVPDSFLLSLDIHSKVPVLTMLRFNNYYSNVRSSAWKIHGHNSASLGFYSKRDSLPDSKSKAPRGTDCTSIEFAFLTCLTQGQMPSRSSPLLVSRRADLLAQWTRLYWKRDAIAKRKECEGPGVSARTKLKFSRSRVVSGWVADVQLRGRRQRLLSAIIA